jgi:hypothetical protein
MRVGIDEHSSREVITMDTGHSPFLSAPEELAGHLLALTR